MPDQGTQRCLDDAGKTCRRPSLSRRRESNRCHDDGKREQPPGRWRDSRLRRGVSRKLGRVDALTYSDRPQSSLSILLLVLYKSGDAKCNVVRILSATPNVMLLVSMKSKTVFQTDTLYSCLLSLVSLSLVSFSLVSFSLTHSYRRIYICFIATENSSVFNLCCTELVQHSHIHSIR